MATKQTSEPNEKDYQYLGKMLVNIYESGYLNKAQFYKMNFIKGLLTGFGSVLGATIVVGLVLWILTLFDQVPIIGPFLENLRSSIQESGM